LIIERTDKVTQAAWRQVFARLTSVIRVLSTAFIGIVALLGGEIPIPSVNDPSDGEDNRPSKALGT